MSGSGSSLAGPESAGGGLVTGTTWPSAVALIVAAAGVSVDPALACVTADPALAGELIVAGMDKLAAKVPLLWLVSEKVPERRNEGAVPTIVAVVFDR
jgi:hypothetical protein